MRRAVPSVDIGASLNKKVNRGTNCLNHDPITGMLAPNMSSDFHPSITAVLGPTNTGKTHLAIERMCAHSSGAIGFPLRLLAREVYDRVRAIKGDNRVALLTGEERIVPDQARWFLATMESLPMERDLAFMGVDEAQLGADPERGHIFTDRMLHARGREETMILGAETLRPMVRALVPDAEIVTRPRFSTLSYAGAKKLSRLPPRSAIVAFSVEEVYAVAEMLRRFRGGAAVVMGALSPHTRNKQVEMFQNGEVDYLVATDAIGMGLNMDVNHIAFASLRKFDGTRQRRLLPTEMAQIAGRAGRHQRDGTFGTLAGERGGNNEFTPEEIAAIEDNRFQPLSQLYWRDAQPRTDSLETLIADLERKPGRGELRAAPEAVDLAVLRRLAADPAIAAQVRGPKAVRRLWEACSLPDFRKLGADHHARFVAQLWHDLSRGHGHLPHSFMARKIAELDTVQGDVDVLAGRIAAIRTWAYIAQRPDWLANPAEMAERARGVEQKLSDALHRALAQRFVDRRTTVLMRQVGKDAGLLPVTLDENQVVKVDGEPIGSLRGFAFVVDADARHADRKLLLAAAEKYLGEMLTGRAAELTGEDEKLFTLAADKTGRTGIVWRDNVVAWLEKGPDILHPRIVPDRSLDLLPEAVGARVLAHLAAMVEAKVARVMMPLHKAEERTRDPACAAPSRALFVQMIEGGGVMRRSDAAPMLAALDADARSGLRRSGVNIGTLSLFMHLMIKPAAQEMFALLQSVHRGTAAPDTSAIESFAPVVPAPDRGPPPPAYLGFGDQWLRADMAEKLIRAAHLGRTDTEAFPIDEALPISMGLDQASYHAMLRDAGFRRADAPAPAEKDAPVAAPAEEDAPPAAAPAGPQPETDTGQAALTASATPDTLETEAAPETPTDPPAEAADASDAADAADMPGGHVPVPTPVFYWTWRGIKKRPQQGQQPRPRKNDKPGPKPERPPRPAARSAPHKAADPNSPFAILGNMKLESGKKDGKTRGKADAGKP